jgi:hypothetical protein
MRQEVEHIVINQWRKMVEGVRRQAASTPAHAEQQLTGW